MSGKGKLAAGLLGVILITSAGDRDSNLDVIYDCRVEIKRSFTTEELNCVNDCWRYAESTANSSGASCNLRGSWCSWWADGFTNCLTGAIGSKTCGAITSRDIPGIVNTDLNCNLDGCGTLQYGPVWGLVETLCEGLRNPPHGLRGP